jgi:hypothetical protein
MIQFDYMYLILIRSRKSESGIIIGINLVFRDFIILFNVENVFYS